MEVEAREMVGEDKVQVVIMGFWGHVSVPIGKPRLISPNGEIGKPAVWVGELCILADKKLTKVSTSPIPTFNLYVY